MTDRKVKLSSYLIAEFPDGSITVLKTVRPDPTELIEFEDVEASLLATGWKHDTQLEDEYYQRYIKEKAMF